MLQPLGPLAERLPVPFYRDLSLALIASLAFIAAGDMPEPEGSTHSGYTIQIDLWPDEDSHGARYEVAARFHGPEASAALNLLHRADSTESVDELLQYGIPWTRREGFTWNPTTDTNTVTLSGTYRDSTWTNDAREFLLPTNVAHLFFEMPPSRVVRDSVEMHPFVNTAILRLHQTAHWEPDPDVVAVTIRGATYDGTFESAERRVGTGQWLEVRQRYQMRPAVLSSPEYARLYRDYLRYEAAVRQIYRYRQRIEPLLAQAKRNPGASSIIDASARILGPDWGGSGRSGPARRSAARALLAPLLRSPAAGARPYVLLAQAAKTEGRYRAADSLVSLARAADMNDVEALRLQIDLRSELWDRAGELAAWREWKAIAGDRKHMPTFIGTLYQNGLDSEAEATQRAFLSATPSEASATDEKVVGGYVSGFRCREARAAFSNLDPDDSWRRQALEVDLCHACGPLDRLIEILEPWMEVDPEIPISGEYLAWAYIRLGRNLERAADLIAVASMLEPQDPDVRITGGVLSLRMGKIASARRILGSAMALDDRPRTRVAARYFLGHCDWAEGKTSDARKIWRELLPVRNEEWTAILRETLDLADEGHPEAAVFRDPGSPSRTVRH